MMSDWGRYIYTQRDHHISRQSSVR
jgi:hypothetical protein